MERIPFTLGILLCAGAASAQSIVYSQPPNTSGTLYQSSEMDPDGSDYDQWRWDNFTIPTNRDITRITWRGGFIYGGGFGGPILDFTVEIYPSAAQNTEPDIVGGPLVHYHTGGNAGQTQVGLIGGTMMYDYSFTLPSTFHAAAGVKYWVQIQAFQSGVPEWGLASSNSGDGAHFRGIAGSPFEGPEVYYTFFPGNLCFTLLGPAPTCPADIDGDGDVDSTDLNVVLSTFGCVGPGCSGDIDGDGDTDTTDLNILLSSFGQSCP